MTLGMIPHGLLFAANILYFVRQILLVESDNSPGGEPTFGFVTAPLSTWMLPYFRVSETAWAVVMMRIFRLLNFKTVYDEDF